MSTFKILFWCALALALVAFGLWYWYGAGIYQNCYAISLWHCLQHAAGG